MIVKLIVLDPPAPSVAVPLAGVTVICPELLTAVHDVVSAYVVEASVTTTGAEPLLASETELGAAVMVYAGAVTVSVAVPVDAVYSIPAAGV